MADIELPADINTTNYFRMDKTLVKKKKWAALPLASKMIYPVIGIHTNEEGTAFPSQEKIAELAGCTPKTVREGIDGLDGFPGFRMESYITAKGKRAYRYKITPPQYDKSIFIYRAFFDSGRWGLLHHTSHAVYPALLTFSFFDHDKYVEITDTEISTSEFYTDGYFENREFDFAEPDIDVLAEYAGVSRTSAYQAMGELVEHGFLAEPEEDLWLVLRPKYHLPF